MGPHLAQYLEARGRGPVPPARPKDGHHHTLRPECCGDCSRWGAEMRRWEEECETDGRRQQAATFADHLLQVGDDARWPREIIIGERFTASADGLWDTQTETWDMKW